MALTDLQWAVLSVAKIYSESYQFVQSEGSCAKRLVARGLLEPIGNAKYRITKAGLQEYESENERQARSR